MKFEELMDKVKGNLREIKLIILGGYNTKKMGNYFLQMFDLARLPLPHVIAFEYLETDQRSKYNEIVYDQIVRYSQQIYISELLQGLVENSSERTLKDADIYAQQEMINRVSERCKQVSSREKFKQLIGEGPVYMNSDYEMGKSNISSVNQEEKSDEEEDREESSYQLQQSRRDSSQDYCGSFPEEVIFQNLEFKQGNLHEIAQYKTPSNLEKDFQVFCNRSADIAQAYDMLNNKKRNL